MAHGETRVIMKPNPIISILFIATFFLFGVSAHSENLNEILNQINSDLETKKEARSTNAGTGGQAKEPAQEESPSRSGQFMRPGFPGRRRSRGFSILLRLQM